MYHSFKHFHPDIPFKIYQRDETDRITAETGISIHFMFAPIGRELSVDYDLVVHIDGDSIICDTLEEVLAGDYDIAGCRNNNDDLKAGFCSGFERGKATKDKYINAGFHAITNKAIWQEWIDKNKEYGLQTPLYEQGVLNDIFHSGKYNTKLLDPINSNLYYGVASCNGTQSHWDSYKEMYLENDRLYLHGKKIKILHLAGGGAKPRLSKLFSKDVFENFIKDIIIFD